MVFDSCLDNLDKKSMLWLTNVAIPFVKDNLPWLVSNITSNAINKFERKISGKGIHLFISSEDMNDIISTSNRMASSAINDKFDQW